MRYNNFFFRFFLAVSLSSLFLFLTSCSEESTPGPISPTVKVSPQSTMGKVRPLLRKSDDAVATHRSLAKGLYTDDQLIAMINQQPALSTGALKTILVSESPLSENVLLAVLNRSSKMATGDLKAVFLASTPLPAVVEEAIQHTNLMSSGDLQTVLEAQAGFGGHFLGTTVSKWMTKKEGGQIWHGGHKIKFPAGALPQDSKAAIEISSSNYVQVEFLPDGWFNKEVTVTISYKNVDLSGVDEKSLTLAWYDETTGEWIDVGGSVDIKKKWITANVWHFTQYTISTK